MNNKDMPAYPSYRIEKVEKINDDEDYYYQSGDGGLSKLEYFTAQILQGLCANVQIVNLYSAANDADKISAFAARMAEAALAELEKRQ